MDRFAEVDDQYDPDAVEERVFQYWDDVDAYERTKAHRSDGEDFFFVDGPPYTSGSAHMGHAWNKSLKDCYIRYKRMCGYDVTDRPGYDMHGLPIETKVEEELGFENKKDIEAYGVDAFVDECRAFAEDSLEQLQSDFQSFGVWMDWDDPYETVTPEYMEAAWWGFAQAHDRGLVEQGKRSITQCPRCETAIANNEVEYEDVTDPSIYVKFPLVDREDEGTESSDRASGDGGPASRDGSLVIWTTTPWTIPANTFVAVDGEGEYVGVDAERDGETERLYVAEPKVEEVLSAGRYDDYEVVEELTGEDLVGWTYEHPLREEVPEAPDGADALQVYTGDYVDTHGEGTGLVHSAPGHGEEDFARGQEIGLEIFCPVGGDGVYTDAAGDYAGEFVKDADDDVIADLDSKGLLLHEDATTHSYGHCWRCDTGIVQIVTDQWFITITDVKEDLLDNVDDSEWYPQWARDNRFRDFVEDAPDWNVSRQRYWGIPIPIWLPTEGDEVGDAWSGDMGDAVVIADRPELAERVDQDVDPDEVDLHKGTVDDLTITEDGTTYERVPDVFDVWLDSSVASWGTLNFPAEREAFDDLWPADLIIEAHDQTRGWFWSQLGMGTAAMGEVPYRDVLMYGHALMPDGRAMSKSKDIRIDPHEVIDEHGADPMRLFLLSVNPQGEDMQFSWDETREMQRRLNVFWNVVRFPLPYMEADGFDPDAVSIDELADDLELADRWVLSRLQTVEAEMTEHMEVYENDKAVEALMEFVVEDVSRFYVQVVRERMWDEADSPSKRAAYATLYRVLEETVALFAPFAPFAAEELYGALTGDAGHPTVHMCDWPDPEESLRDPELEDDVAVVRAVEEAGSNARQQAEISLRWPVAEVIVDADDAEIADAIERNSALVKDRLNAAEIDVLEPGEGWGDLAYSAEADMSKLGPTFGDDAGRIMQALNDARVEEPSLDLLNEAIDEATGLDVELAQEMVSFRRETPENAEATEFQVFDGGGVVYILAGNSRKLSSEGWAREVIRRIQEMRKDLELDMDDRIRLDWRVDNATVEAMIAEREELIADEVRADTIANIEDGHHKSWEISNPVGTTTTVNLTIQPIKTPESPD